MAKTSYFACSCALSALVLAMGCAAKQVDVRGYVPATPVASSKNLSDEAALAEQTSAGAQAAQPRDIRVPAETPIAPLAAASAPNAVPRSIRPTRVSFDKAPIAAFINAVYAETLGFSVQIDPSIAAKTDTITLRTGDPVAGKDLFDIAASALRDYGVETIVQSAKTLRFTTTDRQRGGAPIVLRQGGVTAAGDSPVYYYYQVRASSTASLMTVLANSFANKLTFVQSPADNAILISGPPNLIQAALDILDGFDKPRMAGKLVVTLDPIFFTPSRMADALARVLRTAGYGVSTTPDAAPINILALDEVGTVLVFAQDEKIRDFALDWARQLDAPRNSGSDTQAFVYFVQNTDAGSLAQVVNSALGGTGIAAAPARSAAPGSVGSLAGSAQAAAPAVAGPAAPSAVTAGGLRIAVDPSRNALIMMGRAEQYASILPLLRQMDRAPGEVLIEVVLAEITITDSNNLGIELSIGNNLQTGTTSITGGTGGLGIGSSGLNLRLLEPGTGAQAVINALSKKTRVSILSNPRVVAKSGTQAHIQVGTQVPVLRQESTASFTGQTGVTNTVDYIDTGVVLDVRPVIRADSRIDLEVSQEVSEAQTNDTSTINSPLIFTRSIKTQLSLNDNQTVLLGGLKSTNRSNTKAGVPGLRNLPIAGALFRNQSAGKTDTELLIFMTPQIVTQPAVSNELVARYKDTMRKWQTPSGSLEWW